MAEWELTNEEQGKPQEHPGRYWPLGAVIYSEKQKSARAAQAKLVRWLDSKCDTIPHSGYGVIRRDCADCFLGLCRELEVGSGQS